MLKGIFLDLSGVLYEGSTPLPGARDAVARLQASPLKLRFLTNTSRRNRTQLLADLAAMGFAMEAAQLFTAPAAAASWLRNHQRSAYLIVHPDIACEFSGLTCDAPDAVVVGDAEAQQDYAHLDAAFQLLMAGAPLIAIGDNRYFKLDSKLHLDAGPFVKALEYAADTQAIITGKPAAAFFEQALQQAQLAAHEVLMVGDDVFGDVKGALDAGLEACLVKTGKYQVGDETRITGDFRLCADLQTLVNELLD